MANKRKFTKTEFRRSLEGSGGHIGVVAGRLNVTRRTVYRYLNRFADLQQTLKEERQSGRDEIVELAQTRLVEALEAKELNERMVMFALRHYDKEGVPGAVDLGSLFAADVQEIMKARGIEPSEVVKEFEALMRAQAEKAK